MIYAEEMGTKDEAKIMEQISRIDQLVDKLDKGLLESEKVRGFSGDIMNTRLIPGNHLRIPGKYSIRVPF
jgi:hypothetical protein